MPYIIAFVILIVAAGALLLFRQPAEAPVTPVVEVTQEQIEETNRFPEGFTPPNEDPPSANTADIDTELDEEMVVSEAETSSAQTFTAEASYLTPRRTNHDIEVSLTLEDDVVVDTSVLYDGGEAGTPAHSGFDAAYKSEVIGKTLQEIDLSRVGGASLTSDAFNEAVAEIRAEYSA